MSTPSTQKIGNLDPHRLEEAKNIVRALQPNLHPDQLNKIAEAVALQTEAIANTSSSLAEFHDRVQQFKDFHTTRMSQSDREQLKFYHSELAKEQEKILKSNGLAADQPSNPTLDQKIEEATLISIKQGKELQAQNVKHAIYRIASSIKRNTPTSLKNALVVEQ